MKFPVTETERLIIRPLKQADAEHIFKTWASDPRVTRFMIYSTNKSPEDTREWLKRVEEETCDNSYLGLDVGFQLKETGKLIGSGGAYYKPEFDRWSIGYNIAYDYWHMGYTAEAMRTVLDYLIGIGVKHFIADHAVDNPGSGRVMEKLGMKYDHDGSYTCLDGRVFKAKYYILDIE